MRTNTKTVHPGPRTHEGAPAKRITTLQELERSVMACMLWEDEFYESGTAIATRIMQLVEALCAEGRAADVRRVGLRARQEEGLRHVPLLICSCLAAYGELTPAMVRGVCDRADLMGELISVYWTVNGGKRPLPASMKKGLGQAFTRFDAHQLAKYSGRNAAVSPRDVMFLTHPKPSNEREAETWRKLANGELGSPDTWEVALSGGADKGETFTRLIGEGKLGTLALIRNLRSMERAGVDRTVIRSALQQASAARILPFQVIAAAKHAPSFEQDLEEFLFRACGNLAPLRGRTAVVVDCSGSMDAALSRRGTMSRREAAVGTAMIVREVCEDAVPIAFGDVVKTLRPRRGFALRDQIMRSDVGHSTNMGDAARHAFKQNVDRVILFTDEQSVQRLPDPPEGVHGYVVNVASAQNGIGYGTWTHIDGFSTNILRYIPELEAHDEWVPVAG